MKLRLSEILPHYLSRDIGLEIWQKVTTLFSLLFLPFHSAFIYLFICLFRFHLYTERACNAIGKIQFYQPAAWHLFRTYMHFTGFHKIVSTFAGDVSLASFINFTSTLTGYTLPLVQHYHHIQFYFVLLLAFFTACLLLSPVLRNPVSTFHWVWTLGHLWFLTAPISYLLKYIIFIHNGFPFTPGLMYNNSSYKFEQHKWSDSHTRCQVLLQQYLEELQEPWHW